AVDHPRRQDRLLGWAALALEEAAWDLPGGVHALLDVDGQRKEVGAFTRLRLALSSRQHLRVALAHDDGAVGLLGQLAGLECDLAARDLHAHRGRALRCNAHLILHFFLEGGGLSQLRDAAGLAQTSTPVLISAIS